MMPPRIRLWHREAWIADAAWHSEDAPLARFLNLMVPYDGSPEWPSAYGYMLHRAVTLFGAEILEDAPMPPFDPNVVY
jgi:hypothetical protein